MSAGARQLIQFELPGLGPVELDLAADSRTFVFFGSNGVGKTRCLETLYIFYLLHSDLFHQTKERSAITRQFIPKILVDGHLSLGVSDEFRLRHSHFIEELIFSENHRSPHPAVMISAGARASLPAEKESLRSLGSFESRQANLISRTSAAFEGGSLRQYSVVEDPRRWFVLRAQSVNVYQKASDNRNKDIVTLLESLHEIDPRIDATRLVVDGDERVFLTIEGQERELSELSSGFISLVKLIQSIVAAYSDWTNEADLRQIPGTVFIDEIESHLHPQWQAHIVGRLQTLFPKTRFYIATHSPLVLSRLKDGEAYVLQRDEDGVVRSQAIASPSKRVMADLLKQGFDVDLNSLKREDLLNSDQSQAKQALLDLLQSDASVAPQTPARDQP